MEVLKGSADVTTYFVLRLAADGTEATGLTITDIDLQYVRNRTAPAAKVDATALAATDTAHTDNYAIEVDATDQPGLYRVDWPDAAFATGVDKVILTVKCATCFTEHLQVDLVNFNSQDGVRLGLTALPNAAADAAGGLPISDAGGLDLDAIKAKTDNLATDTEIATAVWDEDATAHQTAGTFGKAIGDPGSATNSLIARTPDAVAGAAGGLFIAGTNAATTITTALTTTFTGNLTGSVGSVTGEVDVGKINGVTITGDGDSTPFGV